MSPRRIAAEELTPDQILQAARQMFAESGYRNTSMRALAHKLGRSHGAIYYHYKDKAQLYYAVIGQDFNKLDALLAQTLEGRQPSPDVLRDVITEYIRFGLDSPHAYELMFMTKEDGLNGYAEPDKSRSYMNFAAAVRVCMDAEGERGEEAVWKLFLAMHGFVAHGIMQGLSYDQTEAAAAAYADFLLAGALASI